jgi:hypothetical protein
MNITPESVGPLSRPSYSGFRRAARATFTSSTSARTVSFLQIVGYDPIVGLSKNGTLLGQRGEFRFVTELEYEQIRIKKGQKKPCAALLKSVKCRNRRKTPELSAFSRV